ncbi:MAG: hypothetical protein AAGC53_22525 [Actinomycetota bacterium]
MGEPRSDGPIEHPDLAPKAGFTWGRLVVTLILVALLVMWAYIWVFVPRDNPDRFASRAFPEAAEPVCAVAQAEIDALPLGSTAATPQERAVAVREGTVITERLIAELRELTSLVDDPDDLAILERWFEDWEDGYLVDRWAHVERLENATPDTDDRDLAFLIQERVEGGFYTRRIDGLANVNDMASCVVPGDI